MKLYLYYITRLHLYFLHLIGTYFIPLACAQFYCPGGRSNLYSSYKNIYQPNSFLQPNVVTNNIRLPQEITVKSSRLILNLDFLDFFA